MDYLSLSHSNHQVKKGLALLATLAIAMASLLPLGTAYAADTTASQTTSAGTLSITSPSTATLDTLSVLGTNQTAAGTVTAITPSDLRGSGAGWTVSMTSTYLRISSTDVKKRRIVGATGITLSDVAVTGTYDGLNPQSTYSGTGSVPSGEFAITVNTVTGTPAKPATVTVTLPDASSSTPTVTSNAITFNGMTVTFGGSNAYAATDKFGILVDAYPYAQLTVTPATLAGSGTPAASITNMALGSASAFGGSGATSTARTDLVADPNEGMGAYTYNDGLSWILHSNSLQGSYSATFTYTVV